MKNTLVEHNRYILLQRILQSPSEQRQAREIVVVIRVNETPDIPMLYLYNESDLRLVF